MKSGRINEGGPPTSHEWNEYEARLRDEHLVLSKHRHRVQGSGLPPQLPELTAEQIAGRAVRIEKALRMAVEALDREVWDGRWGNRLMQAHTYGRTVLEEASTWTAQVVEEQAQEDVDG